MLLYFDRINDFFPKTIITKLADPNILIGVKSTIFLLFKKTNRF